MTTHFRVLVAALGLSGFAATAKLQGELVSLEELGSQENADSLVNQGFIEPMGDPSAPEVSEPTPATDSVRAFLVLGLKVPEGYVLTEEDLQYIHGIKAGGVLELDMEALKALTRDQIAKDHVVLFDETYKVGNKSKAAVLVDLQALATAYVEAYELPEAPTEEDGDGEAPGDPETGAPAPDGSEGGDTPPGAPAGTEGEPPTQ